MTTTLFSFGYFGWGTQTRDLVNVVDAVEARRGYRPPIFVDIRINRSVRAVGFHGNAFQDCLDSVGHARYRWMNSLGNEFIQTQTGQAIQINEPAAANELLDLAIESSKHNQRLIFFCSCQWPKCDGEIVCHRVAVADLILEAARRRRESVEIVEWPGGEPSQISLPVPNSTFAAVNKGRKAVPLREAHLDATAGLPWCSVATLSSDGRELKRIVGPARKKSDRWVLPVMFSSRREELALEQCQDVGRELRMNLGLNAVCP